MSGRPTYARKPAKATGSGTCRLHPTYKAQRKPHSFRAECTCLAQWHQKLADELMGAADFYKCAIGQTERHFCRERFLAILRRA